MCTHLPPACRRNCPAGLCKLDLMLVSQTVESVWLSALYPVSRDAWPGAAVNLDAAVWCCLHLRQVSCSTTHSLACPLPPARR